MNRKNNFMCNSVFIEPYNEELECRKLILQSIECALKRGDEIFEKLVAKEKESPEVSYHKFKESLKKINHENLKK